MLGVLLVTGLTFSLFVSRTRIPRIAVYALAGLVWSPDLLGGVFHFDMTGWSGHLTDLALAIIAYLIGGSVTTAQLRRLGRTIAWCTFGEVFGAVIVVTLLTSLLLFLLQSDGMGVALVLGALAASTAPAATVAVIHQYRSKGPLTTTLLGVVALDDAVGIILFSLLLVWTTGLGLSDALLLSGREILGGVLFGAVLGWLLALLGHRVRNRDFFLPMVLAALLLGQGLAQQWGISPLLTAMTTGFVARATFQAGGERLFAPIEFLEELVFLIFFTLAGAHFQFSVFMQGLELIVVYVVARVLGKLAGTRLAARLSGAPDVVTQNLGLAVVPQAGIAIGLALSLLHHPGFTESGLLIVNVILASTLIYELLGPFATRYALSRAGEINQGERMP